MLECLWRKLVSDSAYILKGTVTTSSFTDNIGTEDNIEYQVSDVDTGGVESPRSVVVIFKRASLSIDSVETPYSTVTRGQMGIKVFVTVSNAGVSPTLVNAASLTFTPGSGIYEWNCETAMPATIPPASSTILTFNVDVLSSSSPELDTIDATASGESQLTHMPIGDDHAEVTDSWLIRSPAKLVVTQISVPPLVYRDQLNVPVDIEVLNDGEKNSAGYLDDVDLTFAIGSYSNIRAVASLPVILYSAMATTVQYLVDVDPDCATGVDTIDAEITFRDGNILYPVQNLDGAAVPGNWTVVAGRLNTYKGPATYPAYAIPWDAFNVGSTTVYAKAEFLEPIAEYRVYWSGPGGVPSHVSEPPVTSDDDGVLVDEFPLPVGAPVGTWSVVVKKVQTTNAVAEHAFQVLNPASLSVIPYLPAQVSSGQVFLGGMTFVETRGAQIDAAFPGTITPKIGNSGGALRQTDPSPPSIDVPGLGQATVTWYWKANDPGSFTIEGNGYGYDGNDSTFLTAATQSSRMCWVQAPANLRVTGLVATEAPVFRNQQGLKVFLNVSNIGEAGAWVDDASLSFTLGAYHQILASPPILPFLLEGGRSTTFQFEVQVDINSATGTSYIVGTYTGYDANDPTKQLRYVSSGTYTAGSWVIGGTMGNRGVFGICSANSSRSPEQYHFTSGPTAYNYCKFGNLIGATEYRIVYFTPAGAEASISKNLTPDAANELPFQLPLPSTSPTGRWSVGIYGLQGGGNYDPAKLYGRQFFTVNSEGSLIGTFTLPQTPVEPGATFTATLGVKNTNTAGATLYPVTVSDPIPSPGAAGSVVLLSGPDPASLTIPGGQWATFTWTYQAVDHTGTTGSFSFVATATGIDVNTGAATSTRPIYSSRLLISFRDLTVNTPPFDLGTVPCCQAGTASLEVENTGAVNLTNIVWQKSQPKKTGGAYIPYAYFSFNPATSSADVGLTSPATLSLTVPPNQPAGLYLASMAAYEDMLPTLGSRDSSDPYKEFQVKVTVPDCKFVDVVQDIIDIGDWKPNSTTSSGSITALNNGNLQLTNLTFVLLPGGPAGFTPLFTHDAPGNVLATDVILLGSVSVAIGAVAPGTYDIPCALQEGAAIPAVTSDTFIVRVGVGNQDLVIAPDAVDLGHGTPTMTIPDYGFTIQNTGELDLSKLKAFRRPFENTLNPTLTIAPENIVYTLPSTIAPAPSAPAPATLSLFIPSGTASGTYVATQTLFEDEDGDGTFVGDGNEPYATQTVQVVVDEYVCLQVIPGTVDFGGLAPTENATITFLCRNAGNVELGGLSWLEVDLKNAAAVPLFTTWYDLFKDPPLTAARGQFFEGHGSMTIPVGQADGNYLGNTPQGDLHSVTPAVASDVFTVTCQVGLKKLDIVDTKVVIASASPGLAAGPANYSVKNTGTIILMYPRATATADLQHKTIPGESIPADACSFSPNPLTYLNVNQTRAGGWYVQVPPGQAAGSYTTTVRVWNDANGNLFPDPLEASDTATLEIYVLEKRVLAVTPSTLDLYVVPPGKAATGSIRITNTGNVAIPGVGGETLRSLSYDLWPVSPAPSIPAANVIFQPVPLASALAVNQSVNATVTVVVPINALSVPFNGPQRVYADYKAPLLSWDSSEESTTFQIKLLVGTKGIKVTPDPIDLGEVKPGANITVNFLAQNMATLPLSKLRFAKSPLLSSSGQTIPVSRFSLSPTTVFSISTEGSKTCQASLTAEASAAPAIYSGVQTLYEDEDSSGSWNGTEASDTFVLKVTIATYAAVSINSVIDMGPTTWDETTATATIIVENMGNASLTRLVYEKSPLTGPGTDIPPASCSFLPDSAAAPPPYLPTLGVGQKLFWEVSIGHLSVEQETGYYSGPLKIVAQDPDITPLLASDEALLCFTLTTGGPKVASGTLFQELATVSFAVNPPPDGRFFLSAMVNPGTGSARIGFLQSREDGSQANLDFVDVSAAGAITAGGTNLRFSGLLESIPTGSTASGTWYRIFLAFDYAYNPDLASRTYVILQNTAPNTASYSAWFDGVKFEAASFEGQQRPTSFGRNRQIVSPNNTLDIQGNRRYYEW
ncbi:MAG: hypothetical protein GX442_19920 [Candidatus Riflebacteria bacterium]|nr:hypothetical protein [Candidatus Riflebacteria bacterium]